MLILTAAYCLDGTFFREPYIDTQFVFAPDWINGKTPYKVWSVSNIWVFSQWLECPVPVMDCHEDPIDDYTIMKVSPINGKNIAYYAGANGGAANEPQSFQNIQIVGYVQGKPRPWRAFTNTVTVTENHQPFRRGKASGLGPGTSGGGWFYGFSAREGVGTLIGDTGGWDQGGPNSGIPSYSDVWDDNFLRLDHVATKSECNKKCG
jgi:hypothetical protein